MRTFRSRLLRQSQLLIPFLCLVIEGIAYGQEGDWEHMKRIVPNGYVCGITAVPLQVDGKLDEPSWMSAPWTEDFVDIEGEKKPKPRFRTRARYFGTTVGISPAQPNPTATNWIKLGLLAVRRPPNEMMP